MVKHSFKLREFNVFAFPLPTSAEADLPERGHTFTHREPFLRKVGSYDVNLSILKQLQDGQQSKGLSADSAVVGTNSNFSSLKFQFF